MPGKRYPRAAMKARIIALLEGGYSCVGIAALAGSPSARTMLLWAKADPVFAAQLTAARAWGRGVRRGAFNTSQLYDADRARALLERVRRGETLARLTRTPGQPNAAVLTLWKRLAPDFAAALRAAVCDGRRARPRKWRFDQAMADALVVRVARGERLAALLRDPAMVSEGALVRWRRGRPDFDAALRTAVRVARPGRAAWRPGLTDEVTEAVVDHILAGGTLTSAARTPGVPQWSGTLWRWMRSRPAFADAVNEARRWRALERADAALARTRAAST
jgi:hypothetical protein